MKGYKMRVLSGVAAIAITTLALAGCSSGSAKSAGSADSASMKIGLLLPDRIVARSENADKPFFIAKTKALCPKCEVLYANADADAAKQQQQAESMLTQGIKVLVIDPVDGKAAAAIAAEAKSKNVSVIAYDRLIDSEAVGIYVSFDNQKVGELQAQSLIDKLKTDGVKPGDGGIIMVNGAPTDSNAGQFKTGAHKIIDSSGYKVLAEFDTPGWDSAKAQDWVAGQITRFGKDIKAAYTAGDGTASAAIAAFKAVKVSPIPPTTGQDANLANIQLILAGDQYMDVYKAFKAQAEKTAELAYGLATGVAPKTDSTVQSESGATIKAVLLTPVAVTLENIESTVVKDGVYKASEICTSDYEAACAKAGIK